MSRKEILSGNRLIAEFTGFTYSPTDYLHRDFFTSQEEMYFPEELKYHSSWDWLMHVVERIWAITSCRTLFYFEADEKLTIYSNIQSSDAKIEIWGAVVEFIKWYNENKITKL